jgi:hypothetical protein
VPLNLFRPKEKFLILEIAPNGTSGLFMSIDEDRNLVFERLEKKINVKTFLKSPIRNVSQRSWEGHYLFKSHRKIIAAADSTLATTIPVPLDLKRESHVHGSITMVEFENLFAQAMTMIFNQCRSEAARRLNVEDIHAILVATKANHFDVDGRAVQNPIGCSGKKISFLLELVFTKREIFEEFKPLFGAPEEFFFAESPQVRLVSIARVRRFPLALIIAGDETASLFVLIKAKGGHDVLYREKFVWSFSLIFTAIQNDFHVSGAAARELYTAYCRHGMSPVAGRVFKKTIRPALDAFFDEVKKSKVGGSVYVDSPYDMPFDLPFHAAGVSLENVPTSEILSEVDFSVDAKEFADRPGVLFRYLAPFLEAYFDKNNSEINQKLRRRLHWLAQ